MDIDQKRLAVEAFATKTTKKITAVCEVTGLSYTIEAPLLPFVKGNIYSIQSPLALVSNCIGIGTKLTDKEIRSLPPTTIAGAILSLFTSFKLRHDKLSATEANIILSQAPLHVLSHALTFLSKLSDYDKRKIPAISLTETEPQTLKNWLIDAHKALDITIYEQPQLQVQTAKTNKPFLHTSIESETRREARELLKTLKDMGAISLKLSTIVAISLQKNNLALMNEELRARIVSALFALDLPIASKLASIFQAGGKALTHQESITKNQMETGYENASDSFVAYPRPKLSLAEILINKRKELAVTQNKTKSYIVMLKELATEIDAVNASETLETLETVKEIEDIDSLAELDGSLSFPSDFDSKEV